MALSAQSQSLAGSGVRGYAEGTGAGAQFSFPTNIAIDGENNIVVADFGSHRIRRISPAGVTSLIAGSGVAGYAEGTGADAQFNRPVGIAIDGDHNIVVTDSRNHRIRRISPAGVTSLIAGSGMAGYAEGTGADAQFNCPNGIAIDGENNIIVADSRNHRIRKISPAGMTSLIAGSGVAGYAEGTGADAQFALPADIAIDDEGSVIVADFRNNRFRKLPFACAAAEPLSHAWPECDEEPGQCSSLVDDHLELLRTGKGSDVCFEVTATF